jgi:hypothetical protein
MAVARAKLVEAAKDLNKVCDLNPAIDIKLPVDELAPLVLEASALLRDEDEPQDSTREVVAALQAEQDGGGEEGAEAEGEAKAEEEGETVTKSKAPARGPGKTVAAKAADKPAAKSTGNKPAGIRAYAGSFAEKCDKASMKGGTIEQIAKAAETSPGTIRTHFRYRTSKGKYTMEGDLTDKDSKLKLVPVE